MGWMFSKGDLVEAVVKTFPYPDQIRGMSLDHEPEAIRFTWRGVVFRVDRDGGANEVDGGCLTSGSVASLLAQALVKRGLAKILEERA